MFFCIWELVFPEQVTKKQGNSNWTYENEIQRNDDN